MEQETETTEERLRRIYDEMEQYDGIDALVAYITGYRQALDDVHDRKLPEVDSTDHETFVLERFEDEFL